MASTAQLIGLARLRARPRQFEHVYGHVWAPTAYVLLSLVQGPQLRVKVTVLRELLFRCGRLDAPVYAVALARGSSSRTKAMQMAAWTKRSLERSMKALAPGLELDPSLAIGECVERAMGETCAWAKASPQWSPLSLLEGARARVEPLALPALLDDAETSEPAAGDAIDVPVISALALFGLLLSLNLSSGALVVAPAPAYVVAEREPTKTPPLPSGGHELAAETEIDTPAERHPRPKRPPEDQGTPGGQAEPGPDAVPAGQSGPGGPEPPPSPEPGDWSIPEPEPEPEPEPDPGSVIYSNVDGQLNNGHYVALENAGGECRFEWEGVVLTLSKNSKGDHYEMRTSRKLERAQITAALQALRNDTSLCE